MKTLRPWLIAVLLCLVAANLAQAQERVRIEEHCPYCAMYISKAMQAAIRVEYADGTIATMCSLHCGAKELRAKPGKATKAILAGDYTTRKFTDAEKATWVIGGKVPGLMTSRAKWAFENKAAAEAFVKEDGGTLATFQEALTAADDDLAADDAMIQERKAGKKTETAPKP